MEGLHLGIIPDGSRRWAKKQGIDKFNGDQSGLVAENVMIHAFENYPEIREISIWAISTENLNRPDKQKIDVYVLLEKKIRDLITNSVIHNKKVKVNIVGSIVMDIPDSLKQVIFEVQEKTKDYKERKLNICIGYGGKQEILDAVMASSRWLRKNPTIAKLHENIFEKFLMVPRPLDIVIRTGGEKRLSGFMLYQMQYAELFFTETLWPDFSITEFDKVMQDFSSRQRRFGR